LWGKTHTKDRDLEEKHARKMLLLYTTYVNNLLKLKVEFRGYALRTTVCARPHNRVVVELQYIFYRHYPTPSNFSTADVESRFATTFLSAVPLSIKVCVSDCASDNDEFGKFFAMYGMYAIATLG
jgi:hypothetical protein